MIENACILSITRTTGASMDGDFVYGMEETLAPASGCFLDGVSNSQRYSLGSTIKDVDLVCYIPAEAIPQPALALGDRLSLHYSRDVGTGIEPTLGQVVLTKRRDLDGISHVEVFLKPATT